MNKHSDRSNPISIYASFFNGLQGLTEIMKVLYTEVLLIRENVRYPQIDRKHSAILNLNLIKPLYKEYDLFKNNLMVIEQSIFRNFCIIS